MMASNRCNKNENDNINMQRHYLIFEIYVHN